MVDLGSIETANTVLVYRVERLSLIVTVQVAELPRGGWSEGPALGPTLAKTSLGRFTHLSRHSVERHAAAAAISRSIPV